MTTPSNKTAAKPVGRLDASLLLARKGEAAPSVAATQHNNPGLAWGAPAHPEDFQHQPNAHAPNGAHPGVHQAASLTSIGQPASSSVAPQPVAKARLRPDSFFSAHGRNLSPAHANTSQANIAQANTSRSRSVAETAQERDPVALTMRVEDDTYLRLKYLAQRSGLSTQEVLNEALNHHLVQSGVPQSRRLVVKPE